MGKVTIKSPAPFQGYSETWQQTGGDRSAYDNSAQFAMVRADGNEIRIVEIVNMCASTGEPSCINAEQYGHDGTRKGEHYHVDEYSFTIERHGRGHKRTIYDATPAEIARAMESCGYNGRHGVDILRQCIALFDYGSHRDPRQPSGWCDDHGADFPTLASAMDASGVPQGALIDPAQYGKTYTHDDDTGHES